MDALASKPAVETWPVDRLRPYERNSRRHSPEQIEQIAASIRQWGWTMPILAADDGMVLAGHGRLAAGKLLGFVEVPVIVARGWTEAQKRAYPRRADREERRRRADHPTALQPQDGQQRIAIARRLPQRAP